MANPQLTAFFRNLLMPTIDRCHHPGDAGAGTGRQSEMLGATYGVHPMARPWFGLLILRFRADFASIALGVDRGEWNIARSLIHTSFWP